MPGLNSPVHRIRCDRPGCNKSYLRVEHLNRHRLTHESRMFRCYLCTKEFSRNDLLTAHIRRHDKGKRNDRESVTRRTRSQAARTIEGDPKDFLLQESSATTGQYRDSVRGSDSNPGYISNSAPSSSFMYLGAAGYGTSPQDSIVTTDRLVDADMSWGFSDGGIFGQPDDAYFEFASSDALDGYGSLLTDGGLHYFDLSNGISPLGDVDSLPEEVYQNIILEFPELQNVSFGGSCSMYRLFQEALDYTDYTMPFFHRPTLRLTELPPLLMLALCALGSCISKEAHICEIGKRIHAHVRQRLYTMAMDLTKVDIFTLQSMLLVEHIGFYALSRTVYEMADVFHSVMITLARRSSLLVQDGDNNSKGSGQTLQKRWEEWARRETIKRISYTIFVNDVDLWTQFMHPSVLSVGMMRLPLPCSTALWQAKSAEEWARKMNELKQSSRLSSTKTLRASISLLLSSPEQSKLRRTGIQGFSAGAFTLQVLIHGLASAILEHKFRSVDSGYSQAFDAVKLKEFEQGLACWHACFEHTQLNEEPIEMAHSALVKYHLVSILLRESLSDIQMAAGTAYSWGRAVTPQRAQDAFTRLVSGRLVAIESYQHALKALLLCLSDVGDQDHSHHGSGPVPRALNLTYVPFIAVLVLWAYALGLCRANAATGQRERLQNHIWAMDGARLKQTEVAQLRAGEDVPASAAPFGGGDQDATFPLEAIIQRGLTRRDVPEHELESIREDVRQLMRTIQKRLAGSTWDLANEARAVLTALLDKNGFME